MTDSAVLFLRRSVAREIRRIAEETRGVSDQLWDDAGVIDKAESSEEIRDALKSATARITAMTELLGGGS